MADKTGIQWTDATWNPLAAYDRETGKRGWFCTKKSPGCTNCYAELINVRLGNGHLYRVGNLRKIEWRLVNLDQPLRWKRPRKIFVNSMTDLFHEDVPDEMIDQVFAVMALATQHAFQVLTKRPERMAAYVNSRPRDPVKPDQAVIATELGAESDLHYSVEWPLPNVWLGTSVEDQERADERIPHLLRTPAAVRFLSVEPQLGPIDLRPSLWRWMDISEIPGHALNDGCTEGIARRNELHWVIVGGESGKNARPFALQWAESAIEQCRAAGVACFVKQLGAHAYDHDTPEGGPLYGLRDSHGGDWDEWPEHLRVREFPNVSVPA